MTRVDEKKVEMPNKAKAMEQMPQAAQAMLGGFCQSQAEAAQFVSRSARACLELPATLSASRSLPDVVRAQTEFMQTYWSDWLSTGQRMIAAWANLVPVEAKPASISEPQASRPVADKTDPMAVWQWWRTDMKGIVPRRNEGGGPANGRNGTH